MNLTPLSSTAMELENTMACESESFGQDGHIDAHRPILSTFADHELYQDLIEQFVIGLQQEIHDLDNAIINGNVQMIARVAHKVRGTAATFGYPAFAAVAEKMESTAQSIQKSPQISFDSQYFKMLLNAMSTQHSRMLAALKRY